MILQYPRLVCAISIFSLNKLFEYLPLERAALSNCWPCVAGKTLSAKLSKRSAQIIKQIQEELTSDWVCTLVRLEKPKRAKANQLLRHTHVMGFTVRRSKRPLHICF